MSSGDGSGGATDREMPTVRGESSHEGELASAGFVLEPGDTAGGLESRLLLARARARLTGGDAEPVRIGRYRVLDRLGHGGMGVVWLGVDDELDRKVALKILRTELAPTEAGRTLLLREAQAIAKLSHPNVVHVYEVGHEAEQLYMAMEYVEGDTVRRWLATQTRSVAEILAVYRGAGEALAAAHDAGVVHRDFKPDNVLVGRDGRARVLDFGLARATDLTQTRELPTITSAGSSGAAIDLATTATIAGTPAYMAPEQHGGRRGDARADQFAFCVSLFEALYGQRPFGGSTHTELAARSQQGRIVATDPGARGISAALHAAILRGLSVDPAERFASMPALLEALQRAVTPRRPGLWPLAAIATCAIAIAALRPDGAPPPSVHEQATAPIAAPPREHAIDPIVAASSLPDPVPAPLPGDAAGVTVHRLANGLTVYLAHRPSEPIVSVHVAVRASVGDVAPEDQGLAALVLDAMLQGGDRLGTRDPERERALTATEHGLLRARAQARTEQARTLVDEQLGAVIAAARPLRIAYEPVTLGNALGLRRQTVLANLGATYSAEVPSYRLGAWLQVVAELLQRPAFRDFEAVTAQRLELVRWVSRDSLGWRTAAELLAPVLGRPSNPQRAAEQLASLPLAQAQAFHAKWFLPNNTAIVLVGDLSSEAVMNTIAQHFGAWAPAAVPAPARPAGTMPSVRTAVRVESGAASALDLAWPLPPADTAAGRAARALGHAIGGLEGLAAIAFGRRVPTDVIVHDGPVALTVSLSSQPRDDHAALEDAFMRTLQDTAADRLPEAAWSRAVARAELSRQRWARSRRNLALAISESYLLRQQWVDTAALLSSPITRADLVAGAKALLQQPRVVVDQQPGPPWEIDVPPIPATPLQLATAQRSTAAQQILAAPVAAVEPRFLVQGSHFALQPWGQGRVITSRGDGPLAQLSWVWPAGAADDPWLCDAVRAKLRRFAVAGIDADSVCAVSDTRVELIGTAAGLQAAWPEILAWLDETEIPRTELQAHVADALQYRAYERADALWSTEAVHLWALRGEHGIDAHLPDDASLRRDGVERIAAALARLPTYAPDVLYSGPEPDRVRERLPAPRGRAGAPPRRFEFRAQPQPTIVALHVPGAPQAELRALVAERGDDPRNALFAQLYEFVGDAMSIDPALVRQEVQVFIPPDGGGPIVHGIGVRFPSAKLDVALRTALGFLHRPADHAAFVSARARVEADFRSARVPTAQIPTVVRRWPQATAADATDPRVAQWLALPGLSEQDFARYLAEVAAATPYVSLVGDLEALDLQVLRDHGTVVRVELADILRDSRQAELDVLGMPLVSTEPD